MARYYIIAGESSGDMHAANLMKQLKQRDADATFRFWGGDKMQAVGGTMVKHVNELAFMGFLEVACNIRTILKNIRLCKKDIRAFNPDVLILIDYPGFNLRMASYAKGIGIPVVYYICPQVWAWKQSRVHAIRKNTDKLLVILPFEKEFYKGFNMDVDFPGHPLLDELIPLRESSEYATFKEKNGLPHKPVVALLPGSRKQEIKRMLKDMTTVAAEFAGYQFVVAGVSGQDPAIYEPHTRYANVSLVTDQTYALLANARAALVASGTATLETALFRVPQAVCYKANPVSMFIARRLVKVKYISLVNLIMDKPVLKELIQNDFSQQKVKTELDAILHDQTYRDSLQQAYRELEEKLGGTGASENAAASILEFLQDVQPGKN
ncbi:MAG: lipid-A-disaccharide synthase [Bacteroidia bacterium]|nr:MAG: lipid-A-disaccharide synthase [Bacteroidia bacterium]